ncbi:MAG: hypothetical protein U9Q12_03060 [Patescibacteria group bacterium]|nr:hypothetical protein [Patescibacteria group bacterium]
MCCLFMVLIMLGPRVALICFWLFNTARFNLAFDNIIWPILGVIFIPWTTLMYIIVSPGGIVGWDWLWLGLMLLADIASYGSNAYGHKKNYKF